jgi:hypothetical protein
VEAVAHHHHPERVPADKIGAIPIVYLSNLLAHEQDKQADELEGFVTDEINADVVAQAGFGELLEEWREGLVGTERRDTVRTEGK